MGNTDNRAIAEALIGASKNLSMWTRMTRTSASSLAGYSPELSSRLNGLASEMEELDKEVVDALAGGLAKKGS